MKYVIKFFKLFRRRGWTDALRQDLNNAKKIKQDEVGGKIV